MYGCNIILNSIVLFLSSDLQSIKMFLGNLVSAIEPVSVDLRTLT